MTIPLSDDAMNRAVHALFDGELSDQEDDLYVFPQNSWKIYLTIVIV